MLLNVVLEKTLESSWTVRRSKQSFPKEISPEYSLEGLMLKLKLNSLATRCEELTHLKRPWCWKSVKAGGEGATRGWVGWMSSLTQWTWVWINSGSWWWTGRPGGLQSMGSQRVGQDSATEQQHQRQKLNIWSPAYRLILWAEWDNTFTLKNPFFAYYLVRP